MDSATFFERPPDGYNCEMTSSTNDSSDKLVYAMNVDSLMVVAEVQGKVYES
jgi:hypothetical protein